MSLPGGPGARAGAAGDTHWEHIRAMLGCIGRMENKMETTIIGYILGLYRGHIGRMEHKMEIAI